MAENIINKNLNVFQDPDTEMNQMIPSGGINFNDVKNYASIPATYAAGLYGNYINKNVGENMARSFRTDEMNERLSQQVGNELPPGVNSGSLTYTDFGLPAGPSKYLGDGKFEPTRNFTTPTFREAMNVNSADLANAYTIGNLNFNRNPSGGINYTGNTYDFPQPTFMNNNPMNIPLDELNVNAPEFRFTDYLQGNYDLNQNIPSSKPADAISRTNFNDSYNYNDVDALTADEQAQLPFDRITPQQTMFGKARDLASAGIGKAGKLGMDAFNMLKNNNPLGFVSSLVNTRNPLSPGSSNYNSNLQGQINSLKGQTGTRITGTSDNLKFTDGLSMINGNKYGPGSVLSGKNVTSGFGTNDYELSLEKYIEKMMSYKTRSKFQQAKLDRAKKELAAEQGRQQSILDAAYASQSQAKKDQIEQSTGGRYDGAASRSAYDAEPTAYSGSSKDGGVMGYGGKSGTPRYAQFKEGGKIDAKSFLDMIDVKASGSKSGKQQIQGAPKGITMDNESINAIVRADIPISEKIDILASYGYGKDRSKVEKDNEELFLGEGGYKDRNVGIGFNKDGEGIGGTMIYNIETGNPEYKIRFKKKFSKGGLATMFKLKG